MLSAGGQVPTQTLAPASASALAMANPYPASSATPATSARFPVKSIASMRVDIARRREACKRAPARSSDKPCSCSRTCSCSLGATEHEHQHEHGRSALTALRLTEPAAANG